MSEILQNQSRSIDSMKSELSIFQQHTGELFDGIGEISTKAETLESEKEKLMAEKDKLNRTCNDLMTELEARKVEVRGYLLSCTNHTMLYALCSGKFCY